MMFRNPIMFIVEVVTFVMLFVTIWAATTGDTTQGFFRLQYLSVYCIVRHVAFRQLRRGDCRGTRQGTGRQFA